MHHVFAIFLLNVILQIINDICRYKYGPADNCLYWLSQPSLDVQKAILFVQTGFFIWVRTCLKRGDIEGDWVQISLSQTYKHRQAHNCGPPMNSNSNSSEL